MYVFEETRTSTTGQTQTQLNPKKKTENRRENMKSNIKWKFETQIIKTLLY